VAQTRIDDGVDGNSITRKGYLRLTPAVHKVFADANQVMRYEGEDDEVRFVLMGFAQSFEQHLVDPITGASGV
jgi:hypothetical protein